ncbi:predicted protein [Postia placenta Mad-698-R]|uniref:Uncharacterized protein n=1 Tax=Postia placenta MAD-698-R-SB12 TaxID=670580 RepID=A0A1X6N2I0_9APHY|nr:hypothetical protein POSPLADRAFT_1033501 [Postia placenta MAD-698-R-SB12]EED78540.1 predicted protein [Postia placenta Mad-698-R]OSX62835.1 hypothetical protein POSPLADRAFT_1033501 [Postia placenta MAD-698-R-SB12]
MFAFILTPIALAVAANALPALSTCQNPCNVLGAGSSSSLSYNFTLAALDVNSIDNSTGTALALTTGPPGTSGEASTWWLSTGSGSEFPTFSLSSGILRPNPDAAESQLITHDMSVLSGEAVEFMVMQASSRVTNAVNYCAVSDADNIATIALNGDANSFSLCEMTGSVYMLVYKVSVTNDGSYEYDTCVPKRVQAIQL